MSCRHTAFLDGVIEEEIYSNQQRGFEVHGWYTHVHRLRMLNFSMCIYSLNFADCDIDNNKTSAVDNQASNK